MRLSEEQRKVNKREAQRKYREKNLLKIRERLRDYARKKYQQNPEEGRAILRAYRNKNREKVRQWDRDFYARNREKIIAKKRRWQMEHKEKMRSYDKNRMKRQMHTIQHKARCAVNQALKSGKIIRPIKCSQCNISCKPQAHHHNGYTPENALNIKWLCRDCHKIAHPSKYS